MYYKNSEREPFNPNYVWASLMNRLKGTIDAVNGDPSMGVGKMPTIPQTDIEDIAAGKKDGRQELKDAFMRIGISRGTDYLDATYPGLVGVAPGTRKDDVEEGYLNPFYLTGNFTKVTGPNTVKDLFREDKKEREDLAKALMGNFANYCEALSTRFFGDKDFYQEVLKSIFPEAEVKKELQDLSKEESDALAANPAGLYANTLDGDYKDHVLPYIVVNKKLSVQETFGVGISDASRAITGQGILARNLWASDVTFETIAKNGYKSATDLQGILKDLNLSPTVLGKLGVTQLDIDDLAWSAGVPAKFAGITMKTLIEHLSSEDQVKFFVESNLKKVLTAIDAGSTDAELIAVYNKLLKADPVDVGTKMGALTKDLKDLITDKSAGLNADELGAFRNKDITVGGLTQKVSVLEAASDDVSAKILVASAVKAKKDIFANPVDYTKVTAADYVKDFLVANDLTIQGFMVQSHGQDMWELLTGTGVTPVKTSIGVAVGEALDYAKDEAKKIRFSRVESAIKEIKDTIDNGGSGTLPGIIKAILDKTTSTNEDWTKKYNAKGHTVPRVKAFEDEMKNIENGTHTMTVDKTDPDPLKHVIVVTEIASGAEKRYSNIFAEIKPAVVP